MIPKSIAALSVLAAAMALPAAAQDTTTDAAPAAPAPAAPAPAEAPPAPEAPDAPATAPGADAAAGEAAQAPAASAEDLGLALGQDGEAQPGQVYVRDVFTDWELRCERTEDGEDPCQLYQLLQDGQGNSVAEISLFRVPTNDRVSAGATIVTP